MNRFIARLLLIVLALGVLPVIPSCATDESNTALRRRLDRKNDEYFETQQRRKIRQEARRERYDIWWNRIMGR